MNGTAGSKPTPPSVIARIVAGALWPDVQSQEKLAPGIFWFECAGHGGLVAHLATADLPETATVAAREQQHTELCLVVRNGHRVKRYTTIRHTRDSILDLRAKLPDQTELHELWVGEEDCDWALPMLVSPAAREAFSRHYRDETADGVLKRARGCAQRWNEWFLQVLDPDYVPLPDGGIAYERIRGEVRAAGGVLKSSAEHGPADGIPAGSTRVTFTGAQGRHATYLMGRATHDAVPFDYPASPATYAAHGPIEQVSGPEGR